MHASGRRRSANGGPSPKQCSARPARLPAGVTIDQAAQVDALYWLVYQLCLWWVAEPGTEAALIAVDDAQWSDAPTLRLLMRLTLGLEALPIAIVVAVRSSEQAPDGLLDRLRYHPEARVLRPAELSDEGVAVLVRGGLGADAAPEFCLACATATGGNPFLVGELAASLRVDGLAPTAGAAARVAGMVPSSVLRSVLLRLGRLPAHARELAEAAAGMIGPDAPVAARRCGGAALCR